MNRKEIIYRENDEDKITVNDDCELLYELVTSIMNFYILKKTDELNDDEQVEEKESIKELLVML